jgi:low affinity Fe/Cu permease
VADNPKKAVDIAVEQAEQRSSFNAWFAHLSVHASQAVGSSWMFVLAIAVVVVWGISGPLYHFSNTWQLVINTGTTIVTFLMVFLIQNTQNRDSKAIHLKLNELIHSLKRAHNELIEVEKLSDEELKELDLYYDKIRQECERRGYDKRNEVAKTLQNGRDGKKDSEKKPAA